MIFLGIGMFIIFSLNFLLIKSKSKNKFNISPEEGSIPPDINKWLVPLQYAESIPILFSSKILSFSFEYFIFDIIFFLISKIYISKGLYNGFPI